jgi:hypothetical protein
MKNKWLQFAVYAGSLLISLALNLYHPEVLDVLCTPLPVRQIGNLDSSRFGERLPSNQHSPDREK